jgi:hypothetical protein
MAIKSIWASLGVTPPAAVTKPDTKGKPVPAVKTVLAALDPDPDGFVLALIHYTEASYRDGKKRAAHERIAFLPASKVEGMIDPETRVITFPPDPFAPFTIDEARLAKASAAWEPLHKKMIKK